MAKISSLGSSIISVISTCYRLTVALHKTDYFEAKGVDDKNDIRIAVIILLVHTGLAFGAGIPGEILEKPS
jgi:hypothetical protein